MGVSEKVNQIDCGAVDSEKWVISGIALRTPLKPVFTKSMEKRNFEEEECSTTPTSAESKIPRKLPCPPAPKKRKPIGSSRCHYSGVREFFNPPDLETIFIRRAHGA